MILMICVLALLGLQACGPGGPIDPEQIGAADEIPPGAGLITGSDGAVVLNF